MNLTAWTKRSKKKPSGGRFGKFYRKKRKIDAGFTPTETTIGEEKKKIIRVRGNNKKIRLIKTNYANISMNGKTKKEKILSVEENKANRHYKKRNVITRGAIIKLQGEKLARVTSRPGQEGIVNALLLNEIETKKIIEANTKQSKKSKKTSKKLVKENKNLEKEKETLVEVQTPQNKANQ